MPVYKQTDIVTESKVHGGKRDGAGRKLKYNEPTATIRLPISIIEKLKNSNFEIITNSNDAEIEALKAQLTTAENEFLEQSKLIMKLIKEKKNLEINLSLKKPVQKMESVPVNPPKENVKVNPVNLQGIDGATAKNAKVTLVIDPATIPRVDSTGKKQMPLKIAVESMIFQVDLNSKSYRKAIATIDELGAENCNAILQGSMKTQGKLEGVGLVIQAKKAKEEPSELVTE